MSCQIVQTELKLALRTRQLELTWGPGSPWTPDPSASDHSVAGALVLHYQTLLSFFKSIMKDFHLHCRSLVSAESTARVKKSITQRQLLLALIRPICFLQLELYMWSHQNLPFDLFRKGEMMWEIFLYMCRFYWLVKKLFSVNGLTECSQAGREIER